jgi:hypothetical protein
LIFKYLRPILSTYNGQAWPTPSDAIKRLRLELCKLLILGGSNYDVQLDQLAVTDRFG